MPIVAASSPLAINATFIVDIVVFLALLFLLSRYVFPRIDQALKTRQQQISHALTEAETARKEVEHSRAQEREEMADARRQAQEILDRAQKLGEQLREELLERGRREQEAMLERGRTEMAREREQASRELRRQVGELVIMATSKVLQEELDPSRQRRLVEQALSEVDLSA